MKRTPAALAREAAELFVGETRASDPVANQLDDNITSEGEYRALKALFYGTAKTPTPTVSNTTKRLQ